MSAQALSHTRQFAVPASLENTLQNTGQSRGNATGKGTLASAAPATGVANQSNGDQVTLSDQGKAALDELSKDADILGKLTRESLSAFSPDAGSAQITFDHLTYSKSSNFSLQQSGNGSSFHSDQQQSISGTGHIKTADGREFEFSAELDVSQSLDVNQSGPGGIDLTALAQEALGAAQNGAGNTGIVPPAQNTGIVPPATNTGIVPPPRNTGIVPPDRLSTADNTIKIHLPKLQDLVAAGDQLLDLLKQLNPLNQLNNPATNNSNAAAKTAATAKPVQPQPNPALSSSYQ